VTVAGETAENLAQTHGGSAGAIHHLRDAVRLIFRFLTARDGSYIPLEVGRDLFSGLQRRLKDRTVNSTRSRTEFVRCSIL
jgi:hypothetical protein